MKEGRQSREDGERGRLSVADYEAEARAVMSHMAWEFLASGAADEHTLHWNEEAFQEVRLRPRVLEEAVAADTTVELFGRTLPHPILLAPTAYHRVLHPEGEIATARGARAAEATWVYSTASTVAIEKVVEAGAGPLWFQLYVQEDRAFTRELVSRAEDAGAEALCLTVDTPVLGARNRQTRAGFLLPHGIETPHLQPGLAEAAEVLGRPRTAVTWKEVEWLRSETDLPILLKGILDPSEALRAVQAGCEGVIVSNHGGRNLDTVPASLHALPAVVERVGDSGIVLLDGGVRRGTDVVKALALGARAVLIGRPYCYGLAVAGSEGVRDVVQILRRELEVALLLLGRPVAREIDARALWDRPPGA
jgi:4-hydroxymandelate oxidase